MTFKYLKTTTLLVTLSLTAGCSSLRVSWSDWAKNIAKDDCDIYNRGTSQFDECSERVDMLYEEHYSIKSQDK
ncbi:MAG: hypothetical protein ABJE79_10125 [Marinomonas sp.]